ncbi:MAG: hypothetical protein DIZ80_16835 [endosymbiont of Galathealinum brachiosum]|uniref:Endonuclease/exonuclease/phosphatase domain-containing protein n=1 Tax=endosymbiont of Galathealinum brachiosum TaxID=2200906 RepID=A0A370D6N8_9GAMM|nr:MAG: hypothetical protein DIZ80_16835 [endosymbiont of Galathealinum brachiosum]
MQVVIAYQSLNSNTSSEHNLAASTAQKFQRAAHKTLAGLYPAGSGALKYPTDPRVKSNLALQGPAQLIPAADKSYLDGKNETKKKRSDSDDSEKLKLQAAQTEMLSMVEGKARQIHQIAYRAMAKQCDLIVFGEMDSSHADWATVAGAAGDSIHVSKHQKACHCFSVHGPTNTTIPISEGDGWCAARCSGVLAVFVHVPNNVAGKKSAASRFYKDIKNTLLNTSGGGVVDVFIGDTNQPRDTFSPEVITSGMDQTYRDAHSASSTINPADTWARDGVNHKGTNSANSKKFDVAVYNISTIRKIEVKYFSQFSFTTDQAAAYTDHMGVMVKLEKK